MTCSELESGLPVDIADDEDIARFLTSSSHFNSTMVKPAAYLPNKNGETSVSRHGSTPEDTLWVLGRDAATNRTLHGAAIVTAKVVRAAGLTVTAAEPPARHAEILGWPTDPDPDETRARRKEMAVLIASEAILVLR